MADCIFCKIVKGDIPAYKVYEDESVLAFLDIHPVNPGHLLVIPKESVARIEQLSEDYYEHVMNVVYKMSQVVMNKLKPHRVGIIVDGIHLPDHAHIHVIPLAEEDNIAAHTKTKARFDVETDSATLAAMAKKLQA